jgi:hypothetical protein
MCSAFESIENTSMNLLARIVVILFGLFLIGLAGLVFAKPMHAENFFSSFASSARTHYVEQILRLLIGASLIVLSPTMWHSGVFRLIGWAIVIPSVVLLLIPWQWHHRFGERVLPMLVRHMRLYAVGLLSFGALILFGAFYAQSRGAA